MKTYFRVLTYASPISKFISQYFLFTTLGIIFGLINFTLLKPLFDVLFNEDTNTQITEYPTFTLDVSYFIDLFYYCFQQVARERGTAGALAYVCSSIVLSVLISNIFSYLASNTLAEVRANLIRNLRSDIFEKVMRLHLGFFTEEHKGDLISRLTTDVQEIENTITASFRSVFKDPLTITVYFAALFSMSLKLTLFTLVLLPISGFFISYLIKKLRPKAAKSQESIGRILNILDESLAGMRIIKAFAALGHTSDKFQKEVSRYRKLSISIAHKNNLAAPLSQVLGVMVIAGILLFGGIMVLAEDSSLSASQFTTYVIILTQVLPPLKSVSSTASNMQRGIAASDRVFQIIDLKPKIKNPTNAIKINSFEKNIEFKNINFSYKQTPVLKNISLKIEKGETVALVGASGSGKSTLADLIPRFYDPQAGGIFIDGINLRQLEIQNLRKLLGIVMQESILFNDTIFNNIAFGLKEVEQKKVEEAAKVAYAHDFIMELNDGYNTFIGERGAKLSGGQRQRVSIARALLKNPPILILDEATSALDAESEKTVQLAIAELMKNRTSLVIAHRLSTIKNADQIIVLDKGKIVENGTHTQLLSQEGIFHKLVKMQGS